MKSKYIILGILAFVSFIIILNLPSIKNFSKCEKFNELLELKIESKVKRAFEDSNNHNSYTIEFENNEVIELSPFVENSYELVSFLKRGDLVMKNRGTLSFKIIQKKSGKKMKLFFKIKCN